MSRGYWQKGRFGAAFKIPYRRRGRLLTYAVTGFILVIGCFILAMHQTTFYSSPSSSSPHTGKIPHAWRSRSLEAGLLRVMQYIEREGEVDEILRDALLKRIWKSMKVDLFRDLLVNGSMVGNTGFRTNDSIHDFIQEYPDVVKYVLNNTDLNLDLTREDNNDNAIFSDSGGGIYLNNDGDDRSNVDEKLRKNDRMEREQEYSVNKDNLGTLYKSLLQFEKKKDFQLEGNGKLETIDALGNIQTYSSFSSSKIMTFSNPQNTISPYYKKKLDKILTHPVLNQFDISYKHDQKSACLTPNMDILIAVPSAPGNFERRENVRKSNMIMFAQNPKNKAKLLFFLGVPDPSLGDSSRKIQDDIEKEQSRFGDIVQATFVDSYNNITKKAAQLLHWSSRYCSSGKFLIRIDDDVTVNMTEIINAMEGQFAKFQYFILGHKRINWEPLRNIYSKYTKYFLSYEDFPYKYLPPFLLGGAMGYPIKIAGLLLETMRRVSLTWLDDVFVTGICARKSGIPIFDSAAFHFTHEDKQ